MARDAASERRLVADFALDPRKVVRTYTKGNRQKVILAAAFAAHTELLVLDEPTSGLDPLKDTWGRSGAVAPWRLLRNAGKGEGKYVAIGVQGVTHAFTP